MYFQSTVRGLSGQALESMPFRGLRWPSCPSFSSSDSTEYGEGQSWGDECKNLPLALPQSGGSTVYFTYFEILWSLTIS